VKEYEDEKRKIKENFIHILETKLDKLSERFFIVRVHSLVCACICTVFELIWRQSERVRVCRKCESCSGRS